MPGGAVKVICKLNVPLAAIGVGFVPKVNVPKRFAPLNEPTPRAVVPVKAGLPANVNCGTPMTDPVVLPETVTSSALAIPWPNAMTVMTAMPKLAALKIERIEIPMCVFSVTKRIR